MKNKVHKKASNKPKTTKKKKAAKKAIQVVPEVKPEASTEDLSNVGRQPRELFVEKYGENHFRVIDNIGFVYSNGRWVAVDVDGFNYVEREICSGDPEFVAV